MSVVETVGSGGFKGDGDVRETVVIKTCLRSEVEDIIPAKNAVDDNGFFMDYTVDHGPVFSTVTLRYNSEPKNGSFQTTTNNNLIYNLDIAYIQKPLEDHTSYKTKWNYDLYAKNASATAQSWWDTATNRSDADGSTWLWSKDRPGENWYKIKDRTKPGKEVYDYPAPVVAQSMTVKKRSDAEAFLKTKQSEDGAKLLAPGETYNYKSGFQYWLCKPAGIQEDGKNFIATVNYEYADMGWDTDFYTT